MELRELHRGQTHLGFDAMQALRPHLSDPDMFAQHIDSVQRAEGYRLIAVFSDGSDQAVACAGFRVVHHLAWGRALYCDDLSTLPAHRGHGYAGALLDWMLEEAQRQGCDAMHLDSGVTADRSDAHRLYFNKRMRISSHHFQRPLHS